ncbi:MAG: lysophospholipid acyltransferase family protein [Desulfobacterales bacterium]|jgi:1-acyl-sn-glycerol-3-phosphate acyltransferase
MRIYETVIIRPLMRWLSLFFFKCTGWKREGHLPDVDRYIIIAAPHTSNWDFIYTLCLAFIFRINPQIMMKASWFRGPMGPLFRWLGALPIDRRRSRNVVAQSVEAFQKGRPMVLVVPPSGTRRKVTYWKTGFYHIACGAGVPIALGFIDYQRKVGGFGPLFHPTGDIEQDMVSIREFYRPISGKYPRQESHVLVRPDLKPPC